MKLNKEQKEAVDHVYGPLMVIAGAGTGKTSVITEKIKKLILKNYAKPEEILALTFTEKAAHEMESRIDQALPLGYTQMSVTTFHAFCDKVLREHAIHIGLDPAYTLMTRADAINFLTNNIFDLGLQYFLPRGNPIKFLFGLLTHFSRLQDEAISPSDYINWTQGKIPESDTLNELDVVKWVELSSAFKKYSDLKVKNSLFDFGDLINYTIELFEKRPNIKAVYQKRFPFIVVDEYQDTNFAQSKLIKLLSSEKNNITVVLDDDQAIYSFRGAAISNALTFRESFPDTKVVSLIKNYRSKSEILDAAYRLITNNNPNRLESIEKIDKRLVATRGTGGTINLFVENTALDEAERIAETIKRKIQDGFEARDIAVLVRANNHADIISHVLSSYDIPYEFLGPGNLYARAEVQDLIAFLEVINSVDDPQAMYRILSMDIFEIDKRDLAKLVSFAKTNSLSLFEANERSTEAHISEASVKKIKEITDSIIKFSARSQKEPAGALLLEFIQSTGMNESILSADDEKSLEKAQNIALFLKRIATYESGKLKSTAQSTLNWLHLQIDLGETPQTAEVDLDVEDTVKIMTVHSSKGLEFPIVFLTNLVSLRFPSTTRADQIPIPDSLGKNVFDRDSHLAEERRLFYVAMTRAKDELYLTAARFYGDAKREKKLSIFIEEAIGNVKMESKKEVREKPVKSSESIEKVAINYLSYTQIETFKICPLHYKLNYILKIPTPVSAQQSFGSSVHEALKVIGQRTMDGVEVRQKDLSQILMSVWQTKGYMSKTHREKEFVRAEEYLSIFMKEISPKLATPKLIEFPFKFALDKSLTVGGKMDRVGVTTDGIEIIDFKTGLKIPNEKEAQKNLQLSIYAIASSNLKDSLFSKNKGSVSLSLVYFDPPTIVRTVRSAKEIEKARLEIFKVKDEIETSLFNCSKHFLCEDCEFRSYCLENQKLSLTRES